MICDCLGLISFAVCPFPPNSSNNKLLKLVKQCLSFQDLLLEKHYQTHVFHSGFLKRALGTFDMDLSFLWL